MAYRIPVVLKTLNVTKVLFRMYKYGGFLKPMAFLGSSNHKD